MMKNIGLFLGIIVGTFIVIVAMAVGFSRMTNAPINQETLLGDARNAKGPESARVTIVEFSDLQCPACASAESLVGSLVEQYPDDIRLIYRHFPLDSIHPYAFDMARMAEVAAQDDKFFPFVNIAFSSQQAWASGDRDNLKNEVIKIAEELELPPEMFIEALDNDQILISGVLKDQADAINLGLNSTPTFFVNGERVQIPDLVTAVEKIIKE